MPQLSKEIQDKLDSGDYRLVTPGENGKAITYPGEIVIKYDGIILAYTANIINKK